LPSRAWFVIFILSPDRNPMVPEKLTTYLQIAGALLGIPVAAAGSYSVYRNYFTPDVACQNLRSAIVTIMEKKVPDETKRGLLRKDVAEFDKKCSEFDPDSQVIFQAALQPEQQPQRVASARQQSLRPPQIAASGPPGSTAGVTVAGAPQALLSAATNFGLSPSGERRGWVSLMRRESGKDLVSQFDGYTATDMALPTVGAMLTARHMLPVWIEPFAQRMNDPTVLQGRLAAGTCVRVLATRQGPMRQWAEVTPMNCP
jgi:hypothetical protein